MSDRPLSGVRFDPRARRAVLHLPARAAWRRSDQGRSADGRVGSPSELGRNLGVVGAAFKLTGSPLHPRAAPRPVGADSVAILAELGYDADRIAELARQEIIATAG